MNEENFNSINEVNNEQNTPVMETPTMNIPMENTSSVTTVSNIDTPITTVSEDKPVNNGGKKKNPLTIVVIILSILLLAAIGYIVYDQFFANPKTDTKETTEVTEKEEAKEQVIKFDFSKYKTTATTTPVEVGSVTINEKDYKISFMRYDCEKAGQGPSECSEAFDYLTDISVSSSDGTVINNIRTDKGIETVAVLDDRYLFIDTGDIPYTAPNLTSNLLILDSENKFADIHNIETNPLQKYSWTYRSYADIENGKVVSGTEENRKVGYVDKNTIRVGACEKGSVAGTQKYVEYTVIIKDGEVTAKQDFSKDGVYCSAQME